MNDTKTDWQEGETLLTTAPQETTSSTTLVPALTILAHGVSSRIGDRLLLPALAAGLEVRLSRLEPVFKAPRQRAARPLESRHLSRKPLRLLPGREPGAVLLDGSSTRTAVHVAGQPLREPREFCVDDLADGVVLTLGHRIVLLLHLLPEMLPEEEPGFGLVGESPAMTRLRREIRRLAPLGVPVLLCGETGTGKELTARALHQASSRRSQPFVAVNMAALPPTLAASELFGATRGAYTGADQAKIGLFQRAQRGTLFLDEIGETPGEVQPMILRALENREIRPVGSTKTQAIDVRVVAATDADLGSAIAEGRFRAPLYHRLAGYTVHLPALRDRRDDIGRLLQFFLDQELGDATWPPGQDGRPWPPAELTARLAGHAWLGNVRELRNLVRRLVISGRDTSAEDLTAQIDELLQSTLGTPRVSAAPKPVPPPVATAPATPPRRRLLRKASDVGDEELLDALEHNQYRLKPTAEALGVSRINLYRLIEACPQARTAADLNPPEIRDALAHHDHDLKRAAAELRVSTQGLKRRMTALSIQ